jgi:hypothetical protein
MAEIIDSNLQSNLQSQDEKSREYSDSALWSFKANYIQEKDTRMFSIEQGNRNLTPTIDNSIKGDKNIKLVHVDDNLISARGQDTFEDHHEISETAAHQDSAKQIFKNKG